jgi:hypothetical protein
VQTKRKKKERMNEKKEIANGRISRDR